MKIVNSIESINPVVWENFVSSHPNGNYFQMPQFIDLISKTDYDAVTIFVLSEKEELLGVLCGVLQREGKGIKKTLSSRIFVWGGPLVLDNNSEIVSILIKELVLRFAKAVTYFEFRNLFFIKNFEKTFNDNNFVYKPHLNYIVTIDTEKAIHQRMSKSKVRQIKSSQKNGAVIIEAQSDSEVARFYDILQNLYKTKIKKPLPDLSFFLYFFETKTNGKIFLIKSEEEILGGIVCPIFKNKVIYEWYICGLNGRGKGIFPSVLATYAPIEYAVKNGFNQFDFLGAGSAGADYGVREFKSKFGGELVENGRYIRINKPILYKIGIIGLKVLGIFKKI